MFQCIIIVSPFLLVIFSCMYFSVKFIIQLKQMACFCLVKVLYTSLIDNNLGLAIIIIIQVQIRAILSFQIRTGLFIFGFGPWWHVEREARFLKAYANHTMLTPPQCTAHLVMFKISIHLSRSRSGRLNLTLNGRKTTCLNGRILNWRLFKIFKFSGPSLMSMTSSTLQPHFLSGGLLWQLVIVISFAHERKTAPSDNAPELKRPE